MIPLGDSGVAILGNAPVVASLVGDKVVISMTLIGGQFSPLSPRFDAKQVTVRILGTLPLADVVALFQAPAEQAATEADAPA